MARKKKNTNTVEKSDLGTPETRRRVTADPLLSASIETHRLQAAFAIRAALEDGLSAPALDMFVSEWAAGHPAATAHIYRRPRRTLRTALATAAGSRLAAPSSLNTTSSNFSPSARAFARSPLPSISAVAASPRSLTRAWGSRRHHRAPARMAVWEAKADVTSIPDPETTVHAMPGRAVFRNRAIRNDNKTREHHDH